jgi:hypothetical protein
MLVVPRGLYPGGTGSDCQPQLDAADDAVPAKVYDLVDAGAKYGLEDCLPYVLDIGWSYLKYPRPFPPVSALGQDPALPLLGG